MHGFSFPTTTSSTFNPHLNLHKKHLLMKKIKAYIIDDNVEAAEVLQILMEKHYPVEVTGTAANAYDAIDDLTEKTTDIIFLDIEMPEISGLEFCQIIRQQISPDTKVVFYSAHPNYAIDAIRREAFDFLLKPPSVEEIGNIIKRYYENKLTTLKSVDYPCSYPRPLLVVNFKNELTRLDVNDCVVFHFRQEDNYWEVMCKDGAVYPLRRRTNSDIILSLTQNYVQINKRHIVNLHYIDMIAENKCIMNTSVSIDADLSISRSFKQSFLDAFNAI